MTTSRITIRAGMVALALGLGVCAWAQDSSASLGDVARKTRKERRSPAHEAARQVVNEEEDGPDPGGVWRVKLCTRTPCYELSIALPKSPKWIRPTAEPRPVLIPLAGQEDDLSHAIRIYAAESLGVPYSPTNGAQRLFLQGWFSRPEYFGQAARLIRDEYVFIDGAHATMTDFSVASGALHYHGLSVVVSSPNGNSGFACLYRDEDARAAASICDAIVKSARSQVLEPAKLPVYPTYQEPPASDPDDPPDDPPESDPQSR